jgi:hypothetical protein
MMLDEKVTMPQGLVIRLRDAVDSNLRQFVGCSDNPRFDYCCNFCGSSSSESHTIKHQPDCEGLALRQELQEVLGG